jgi:hypothetical protein
MVKYESKCKRCQNALKFFKDKKEQEQVDCRKQGIRNARAPKSQCPDFDEIYDFTMINMDKPFSEWKWVKKEK